MNKWISSTFAGIAAIMSVVTAFAATGDSDTKQRVVHPTVKSLSAFESERANAEGTRNAKVLNRDLADDLEFGHGGGQVIGKAAYLKEYGQTGSNSFVEKVMVIESSAKVYGDIGLTNGIIIKELGNIGNHVARYLGVYRYAHGRWQLIRWQTTDLSRPTPPN